MNLKTLWLFAVLAGLLASSGCKKSPSTSESTDANSGDEPSWTQLEMTIDYQRHGTFATSREGTFRFRMQATVNQVMDKNPPGSGERWPAYYVPGDYTPSGSVDGTVSLSAEGLLDERRAQASVAGTFNSLEQIALTQIKPGAPFGEGLVAEGSVNLALTGTVTSPLPPMPGTTQQDAILLWPTPVRNDAERGLVLEGTMTLLPPRGPEPTDALEKQLVDIAYSAETVPGLGGLSLPFSGAVVRGSGDDWALTLDREATFELTSGGTYTDRLSVKIRPVPLTLPKPKARPSP